MAEVTPLIRDELLPPRGPERRHLISITDLTKDDVERLLALARTFAASLEREVKKLPALKGRTVVNVFYESSTRTSSSFVALTTGWACNGCSPPRTTTSSR